MPSGIAARAPVVVVGAGPAGLMAAERLADGGARVEVRDAMPAAGRKFLVAGRGGLNLTHSEPLTAFIRRYGAAADHLEPFLRRFGPGELRAWADALGAETFVGTSGRVFPKALKAAGLLKAWLDRLRSLGVVFRYRSRWLGWDERGALRFATRRDGPAIDPRIVHADAPPADDDGAERAETVEAAATVLALGGASWPETGSDGGWVGALSARGVRLAPFAPANCGFDVDWPAELAAKLAGEPLKNVRVGCGDARALGELVLTRHGVEGGAIYAIARAVREAIAAHGEARLTLDLKPDLDEPALRARLAKPRGSASWSTFARKALRLPGHAWALARALGGDATREPATLAALVKALPLTALGPRPIGEAISSAGGVAFAEVDERLMLRRLPGCFACGEMLDWEAPTGGYLLQACFATGAAAGDAALAWSRRAAR